MIRRLWLGMKHRPVRIGLYALLWLAVAAAWHQAVPVPRIRQSKLLEQAPPRSTRASAQDSSTGNNAQLVAALRAYPPPEHFRVVKKEAGKQFPLPVSIPCNAAAKVLAIFRVGVEYRADPAAATVNYAAPCAQGTASFATVLETTINSAPGEYYAFFADQGPSGLWYNPQ